MIKVSWEPWELAVWEEMREARQEAAAAWLAESDLAGRWVGGWAEQTHRGLGSTDFLAVRSCIASLGNSRFKRLCPVPRVTS